MAGKSKIVLGALESLADLFTMPKVKQAMVEDAIQDPEVIDVHQIVDPYALVESKAAINAAYDDIFDAPGSAAPALEDFGDEFLDEMIKFVEKGAIPKDPVAKSMVDSLFDRGFSDNFARLFIDSEISDIIKPKSGTFMDISVSPEKALEAKYFSTSPKQKFGRKDQFGKYRPADEKNKFGFYDEFGQWVPPDD
jgi:hypothetical protein